MGDVEITSLSRSPRGSFAARGDWLSVVLVAAAHLTFDIALGISRCDRLPLIGLRSALTDAEFYFDSAIFEIHRKGND